MKMTADFDILQHGEFVEQLYQLKRAHEAALGDQMIFLKKTVFNVLIPLEEYTLNSSLSHKI